MALSLRAVEVWKYIIEALLYPHSWIPAAASRLISRLLPEIKTTGRNRNLKWEA